MKSSRTRRIGLSWTVGTLVASAALGSAQAATGVVANAGRGQKALAVKVDPQGIVSRVCDKEPCSTEGGSRLELPRDVQPLMANAKAQVIELAGGRRLVQVKAIGQTQGQAWVALLAAPLAGKGNEAKLIWSGWTGKIQGEDGEGRRFAVMEEPLASGGRRVLVGQERDDVTICGRPALVLVKEVDPETLSLVRGASAQSLPLEERAHAEKIKATRVEDHAENKASGARLLRATVASSAVERRFGTLTDGNPETVWSENKKGSGEGEFVSLASSEDVPIASLEIVVRPTEAIEGGAAPKVFYLATNKKLFEVTMPEDAWKQPPGTRYSIQLPEALRSSCVSVVLGEAYAPKEKDRKDEKKPQVTLAEIEAKTPYDGMSLPELAKALAGGGDRAKGAAALLGRAGPEGIKATIAAYEEQDAPGRALARDVIEAAPCGAQVPFYAARFSKLLGTMKKGRVSEQEMDPELLRARDRLRRCGRSSAEALSKMVREGSGRTQRMAADELSLIAPDEAVPVLLEAMAKANEVERRELREALSSAAKNARARSALSEEVKEAKFKALPEIVQVDLLRAMGPSIAVVEGAASAFHTLALPTASFRVRYLLLAPAAELAKAGDAQATAFLRASLRTDNDGHVRARAAEVAGKVPSLQGDLLAAVNDPEVRVREAAMNALASALSKGGAVPKGLGGALMRRLSSDPWTFVRVGAARTMGEMPAAAGLDKALGAALADESPLVRMQVLDALGAHRAAAYADEIRDIAESADEYVEVRARAILALGAMCDAKSVDDWTRWAERLKMPMSQGDRQLGSASVAALGMVHPQDLAQRLSPLLQKDVKTAVREMAKAALESKGVCGR